VSKTRDALVAVTITAALLSGWVVANRPRSSHAADLRDLLAGPVCMAANGAPKPGGPSVAEAWERTIRLPIARAKTNYIGADTIELGFQSGSALGRVTFVRVGNHQWRPNSDVATLDWIAVACAATQ
jgi:hypothetical protein